MLATGAGAVPGVGRPGIPAREWGEVLEYSDPATLRANVRRAWADEFVEGRDYFMVEGADLAKFGCNPDSGESPPSGNLRRGPVSMLVLTEHGMYRAAMLSRTPPAEGDEARIRDLDLAASLGMGRDRDIRANIRRAIDAGKIAPHVRDTISRTSMPRGGERDVAVAEYWLTRREVLDLIEHMRSPRAVELRGARAPATCSRPAVASAGAGDAWLATDCKCLVTRPCRLRAGPTATWAGGGKCALPVQSPDPMPSSARDEAQPTSFQAPAHRGSCSLRPRDGRAPRRRPSCPSRPGGADRQRPPCRGSRAPDPRRARRAGCDAPGQGRLLVAHGPEHDALVRRTARLPRWGGRPLRCASPALPRGVAMLTRYDGSPGAVRSGLIPGGALAPRHAVIGGEVSHGD